MIFWNRLTASIGGPQNVLWHGLPTVTPAPTAGLPSNGRRPSVGFGGRVGRPGHNIVIKYRLTEDRAMPWVVGIDEAGYGPNLGPFVQAAVALELPDDDPGGWATLKSSIRRAHEDDDGRLLVDDSKKVYAGGNGFDRLAAGVFAGLRHRPPRVGDLAAAVLAEWGRGHLDGECWYDPADVLEPFDHPEFGDPVRVLTAAVVPTPAFNAAVNRTGTKGSITADGV